MKNTFVSVLSLVFVATASAAAPGRAAAASVWTPLKTGVDKSFSSISCPEPRTCYAVSGLYRIGGTGGIVKTTDGGDSFAVLEIPTSNPLYSISCSSASACYGVGGFGTVLKMTDGGANWLLMTVGARGSLPEFTDVFVFDKDRVIVVGKDAIVYRTEDGGVQWNPRSLQTLADFAGVYFKDASVGYAAGVDGTFMKTSDGGASWTLLRMIPDVKEVRRLRGAGNALVAAGNALYRSVDGGTSWTRMVADPNSPGSIHRSVALPSESVMYSLVGANAVAKTSDGGAKWELATTADGVLLQDIACPLEGYCIAIGGKAGIQR